MVVAITNLIVCLELSLLVRLFNEMRTWAAENAQQSGMTLWRSISADAEDEIN